MKPQRSSVLLGRMDCLTGSAMRWKTLVPFSREKARSATSGVVTGILRAGPPHNGIEPVGEPHPAVGVDGADVAGAVPAVDEGLRVRLFRLKSRELDMAVEFLEFLRGQHYLFNLAGQTSHMDSMSDPETDLEISLAWHVCYQMNADSLLISAAHEEAPAKPSREHCE